MARVVLETGQILKVARVGQFVQAYDFFVPVCQPVQSEVGADKPALPVTRMVMLDPFQDCGDK